MVLFGVVVVVSNFNELVVVTGLFGSQTGLTFEGWIIKIIYED